MISWANSRVSSVGKKTTMKDFRDRSLGDSLFLIDLLYALDPSGIFFNFIHHVKNTCLIQF